MKQKQGTGILFFDAEHDRVLVFRRDNIAGIPFPGMLDIIGGAVETGETPEQTIEREVFEELLDLRTGAGYRLKDYTLFTRFTDSLGIEEYIYARPIDFMIEDIDLLEGECLVWISRADLPTLRMGYGYENVVRTFFASPLMQSKESIDG
jgi:8-oxo-dGTP pyrophosphatase MutT (NUDIX family)